MADPISEETAKRVRYDAETTVLQAVLDAIAGTLDPSTQIADHPSVKFAQMQRLKLEETARLSQQLAADALAMVTHLVRLLGQRP